MNLWKGGNYMKPSKDGEQSVLTNESEAKEIDLTLLEEMEEIITPGSQGTSNCCNDSQW